MEVGQLEASNRWLNWKKWYMHQDAPPIWCPQPEKFGCTKVSSNPTRCCERVEAGCCREVAGWKRKNSQRHPTLFTAIKWRRLTTQWNGLLEVSDNIGRYQNDLYFWWVQEAMVWSYKMRGKCIQTGANERNPSERTQQGTVWDDGRRETGFLELVNIRYSWESVKIKGVMKLIEK